MRRYRWILIVLLIVLGHSIAFGQFSVSPSSMSFSSQPGQNPSPNSDTSTITSQTNNTLNLSSSDNQPWISTSVSPSTITGIGKTSTLTVTINSTNLAVGNYSGTVTVSGGGTSRTVSVSLSVNGATISASPSSVNVTVVAGQRAQSQSITIVVTNGPVSVQITGSNGVSATPSSLSAPGSFSASVDASGMSPGNSFGTLTISCTGNNPCLPTAVSVNITVTKPVGVSVNKTSLQFQAIQGRAAPPAQTISVTSNGFLNFNIANAPVWIKYTPDSGLSSGTPTVVSITVVPSALSPGTNTSSFNVTSANGADPIPISVTATLAKLSLTATPVKGTASLPAGQQQTLAFTLGVSDSAATPVTTSVTTAKGGAWLKTASKDFSAPGAVPTVTLDATSLQVGDYTGTLSYSCAQFDCGKVDVAITLTVTSAAPVPTIKEGGIVTATSFGGSPTLGPGGYIEIYGSNLSSVDRGWADPDFKNGVAPTSLEGVTVKVNGALAFVNYVSSGQVNALLPGNVSAGPAQITVTNSLGTSLGFTANIKALQPVFLAPSSFIVGGKQYAAALLPPDYRTVFALPAGAIFGLPTRPVKPGEILVLYGLGFGDVDPPVPVGTIAPGQVTKLKLPLQILFGQAAANVSYQGLVSGIVTLYQFNVEVPQVDDNDAVPLTFTLGGTPGAQTLYVAVHK